MRLLPVQKTSCGIPEILLRRCFAALREHNDSKQQNRVDRGASILLWLRLPVPARHVVINRLLSAGVKGELGILKSKCYAAFFFFFPNRMPGTNSSVFTQPELGAAVFSRFKVVGIKTCRVIKTRAKDDLLLVRKA